MLHVVHDDNSIHLVIAILNIVSDEADNAFISQIDALKELPLVFPTLLPLGQVNLLRNRLHIVRTLEHAPVSPLAQFHALLNLFRNCTHT